MRRTLVRYIALPLLTFAFVKFIIIGMTPSVTDISRDKALPAVECAMLIGMKDAAEGNRLHRLAMTLLGTAATQDDLRSLQLDAAKRISGSLVPQLSSVPKNDLQEDYEQLRVAEFERRSCRTLGR